jgi:hypothetical protein
LVVAPGAADALPALEDDHVPDAVLREPDGRAQAGESGADDDDVVLLRGRSPSTPGFHRSRHAAFTGS